MNEFIERIKSVSTTIGKDIAEKVNEKRHEKVSFQEAVLLIKGHENCKIERRQLLGNMYNTYHLNIFPHDIHLETKGHADEFILKLSIFSEEKNCFSYRSFDDKEPFQEMVSFPKTLFSKLKGGRSSFVLH